MTRIWLLSLTLVLLGCGTQRTQTPSFTYTVDPTVQPSPSTIPDGPQGPRPLAAAVDEKGLKSTFVINEVLLSPKSQSELQDFLNRYGGVVLSNNAVPAPPPGSGIILDPKYAQPTEYLIKIDPAKLDLTNFKADAEKAGLGGTFKISSDGGAKLLALVAHELAGGQGATANFVGQGDAPGDTVLLKTKESSDGSSDDAFSWAEFGDTGAKANVVRAWQFVAARGIPRRPKIAIIDGGFWLDNSGNSMTADFPTTPLQYDFVDSDYNASGANPWSCGGTACPWHGTGAASVALSIHNNSTGAAGTGGQVADPILFKTSADLYQVKHAVRAAIGWGADVISMSFTMCGNNAFCKIAFEYTGFYNAFEDAGKAGLVMVAAAGNDGQNYEWAPCVLDGVICVGALANGSNTAISYSNYGSFVDIWAPTNIHAVYGNNPMGSLGLTTFGGTSASTPFIAGIAAMMRAYNASLTSDQVKTILQQTGYNNSPDPKVNYYVNAFAAVLNAAGNFLNADGLEPNDTPGQATSLGSGTLFDLNLRNAVDKDVYRLNSVGYTRATLNFAYPDGLGKLALGGGVVKESGCGDPVQVLDKASANSRGYVVDLPPGSSSLLTLSALARLPYNFSSSLSPVTISADAFESNETGNTARLISQGGYDATLHVSNDVDYYSFTATSSNQKPYVFNMVSEDVPLTVRIFDSKNNEIYTNIGPSDCSSLAAFGLPNGTDTYTVKVTANSGGIGKYSFGLGAVDIPPPPLITIFGSLKLWWLDPGDPGDRILKRVLDGFTFQPNVDTSSVLLTGESLHLTLYDLQGNKVAEGQPTSTPGGGPSGERLALGSLPAVQYALSVTRTSQEATGSVQLPAIQYNLKLGVGGQ